MLEMSTPTLICDVASTPEQESNLQCCCWLYLLFKRQEKMAKKLSSQAKKDVVEAIFSAAVATNHWKS